jgi:hypothetical protein
VNSIYSILDTIAKITPKDSTRAEKVSEPVEAKGSIVEGVNSVEERLKSKLQEFKSTVSEGEVCEKCDSTPCQCETTKEGIEDVPTFMRDKAGQPRLTMKDIKKPSAYQYRVGEKEFISLGAAEEFAAGTGQQVEKIEEADMEEGNEFSGELAKAKASGAKEFEVDGKKYQVKEDWVDFQAKKDLYKKQGADVDGRDDDYVVTFSDGTRRRYQEKDGRRIVTSLEPVDKGEPTDDEGNVVKRGRGRPKGAKRALGAKGPTGRSKLLKMGEDVSNLERSLTEDHALREEVFNHILGRFPFEVKQFREASALDETLYDALYDYYFEDMPYNVRKGRVCDPKEWVTERFLGDLGIAMVEEPITATEEPTMMDLNELARLAGIAVPTKESVDPSNSRDYERPAIDRKRAGQEPLTMKDVKDKDEKSERDRKERAGLKVEESCGGMGIAVPDQEQNNLNVTTSFNAADGKKTLNINAEGESAEMLAQLLKLSGLMGGQSAAVVVAKPEQADEQVEEADRDPSYANTPDEKIASVDAATPAGNDLHHAKGSNPNWHGDNPMKTSQFEGIDPVEKLGRELMKEYESIKLSK